MQTVKLRAVQNTHTLVEDWTNREEQKATSKQTDDTKREIRVRVLVQSLFIPTLWTDATSCS